MFSLIRESFPDAPRNHFAILRGPKQADFGSIAEFEARAAQHAHWSNDLRRYGVSAVEIESFSEIDVLLRDLERRISASRVWVSGSWPIDPPSQERDRVYELAERVGRLVAMTGLDLISGAGRLIGPASIAGFVETLREAGPWVIDERLVVRPFPRSLSANPDDRMAWRLMRAELARKAGIVIFLGGLNYKNGEEVVSSGVLEEFELAKETGAFLLPVGATGGAAEAISKALLGSSIPSSGRTAARPEDSELISLQDKNSDSNAIIGIIHKIIKRIP